MMRQVHLEMLPLGPLFDASQEEAKPYEGEGCHPHHHFRPTRWDRWCQELEVITGELLPGEALPLLRHRRQIYREAAIRLWGDKHKVGWVSGSPKW